MAGKGNTIPKAAAQRRRTNKVPGETPIAADGVQRGPDLPFGYDWPQPTRDWWETWRISPQATTFTDTDWAFLLDTALLHAELWAGNAAAAPELRLRVSKFGATPEDRLRLRLSIESPEVAERSVPATKPAAPKRPRALKAV